MMLVGVANCGLRVAGYWILDTGYWSLITDH